MKNKNNKNNKQLFINRHCNDNTVSNFIANNTITSLINNNKEKKYLSTKNTHDVMLSRAELEKKKQDAIKARIYDAVAIRTEELIDDGAISIKDLTALAVKLMPTRVDGKIEHEHSVSFLDIVRKGNEELDQVIDV